MLEGVHAVLAVDPGGTTGVAACHAELQPTLKQTLLEGLTMRKAVEVRGTWRQQANQLYQMVLKFRYVAHVERGIPAERVHIVFENYVPDPHRHGKGAVDLTSVWVMAGAAARIEDPARDEDTILYQMPSEAKTFAKNERLKMWGLWEKGSDHKRDAWRHVAVRLNRILG